MMKTEWDEKPRPPMPNRDIVNHKWSCPAGHIIGEDYLECNLCISGTDRDKENYDREETPEEEKEVIHPADKKYEKTIKNTQENVQKNKEDI